MTGKHSRTMLLVAALALGTAAPLVTRADAPYGGSPQSARTPAAREHVRAAPHASRSHAQTLTLEQAVARVQNRIGGKVLKADSRNLGRFTEYRIKVLTPEGHVRVVTLRSDGRGD